MSNRPARWVDRYPQERRKLDDTWTGVIVGLCIFIVLLAISNWFRTGSIVA